MIELFSVILLLGLFVLLAVNEEVKYKQNATVHCMRHVWRRRDAAGWLPENCDDLKRIQGAPLTCAVCYVKAKEYQ